MAQVYENVTIIFADICGFTSYSSSKQPQEVVSLLSRLFTKFDKACYELQVFKLYTIGDCYVALGFTDKDKRLEPYMEARSILDLAFEMLKIIQEVWEEISFPELGMRIGIHTGDIVGGVVGSNIIRFDIYGENVLIANQMESKGEKMRINISQSTKDILQGYTDLLFQKQKTLFSKDKEIQMYFVEVKNGLEQPQNKVLQ